MRGFTLPIMVAVTLLAGCSIRAPDPPAIPDPQRALGRTLTIIRHSTAAHPAVLKVLFYGQSITSRKWTDEVVHNLSDAYPNVRFDVRNMAIPGFSSERLERTAERDVSEFYPDLIVFHVYGDNHAYERIIRTFRSVTAADVIVSTDHIVTPIEPVCARGVQLRWSPPPGCMGHLYFKQAHWEDFMSGYWIPLMASRYDLAVEPRRIRWSAYLRKNRLPPEALIADAPHPNAAGWKLMAQLFTSWFENVVRSSIGEKPYPETVRSLAPPPPGQNRDYSFTGNRAEIIAAGPLAGRVTALMDGKAAGSIDGCWLDSRVSGLPNEPEWPAVSHISANARDHRMDRWTVRVSNLDDSDDRFDFTVSSALGGADGVGNSKRPFLSTSGRFGIEPGAWYHASARILSGRGEREGTTFTWQRNFICGDQSPIRLSSSAIEQRFVIATGLRNGPHVMRLLTNNGAPAIKEIRVYQPSLRS